MRGENYFLLMAMKSGELYRVYRRPITLRMMDERTTQYANKDELIRTIIENTDVSINPNDVLSVMIVMQPNKGKEIYKNEKGPLYKKDNGVLNMESVAAKFELLAQDKSFVRKFVKKYKGIRNFNNLASSIESALNTGEDYLESLSALAEKLFSTYKGSRNIYLTMRAYELKKKQKESKNESSISDISEEEKKEMMLSYLVEHERELLDIDDFEGNEELSPFDAHKSK